MKITLSVYNSILFGELRPWLRTNKDQKKFQQKLNPVFRWDKGKSVEDFEKALNDALKDHPLLPPGDEEVLIEFEGNKVSVIPTSSEIFEPLIDIDIRPSYNPKTEYYYYLIRNEGTRLTHRLYQAIDNCKTANLAKSAINLTLDKIKFLLAEAGKQKKKIGYADDLPFDATPTDETEGLKKDCDYILDVLQTTLIRLILELQELFPTQLAANPLSEDDIYLQILGTPSPHMMVAKKITKLNEFIVKRFIEQKVYSKEEAIKKIDGSLKHHLLYKDTISTLSDSAERKDGLATHIQALENLIYLREFVVIDQFLSYEDLLTNESNESIFISQTEKLFDSIEAHSTPNKRLEIIAYEEDKLCFLKSFYVVEESFFKISIPRKILKWLEIQKAYIKENLHIDFSKLNGINLPKIQTSLTVAQIGYLLRTLTDEGILLPKHKTYLAKAFSAILSSKKKDDITNDGLHKEFKTPKHNAVSFWEDLFMNLKQKAYKDKEKYLD